MSSSSGDTEGAVLTIPSELPRIGQALPSLANRCYIVGQERRADVVWSRGDFQMLCEHMMNGNSLDHFLAAWVDSRTGRACFSKAAHARADARSGWAWDSITGKAKVKTSIGFYASNDQKRSHWAAIDFDAHNGEHERARQWSLEAFQLLLSQPQLYLVLCSSGGGGFHLFIYSRDYHPVGDWIVLLKQLCSLIGAPIVDGVCEIIPNEKAESQRYGKGIRAPGTLNPKTGSLSLIEVETLGPLLKSLSSSWKNCVGKVREKIPRETAQLSLHKSTNYYSLSTAPLIDQLLAAYPIKQLGTRNALLTKLIGDLFFKFGRKVSEVIITSHYRRYEQYVRTPLEEHVREFAIAWKGFALKIIDSMSPLERRVFADLTTPARKDGFLLVRGFAGAALHNGQTVFQISRASLADRLDITPPGAGEVIRELSSLGAIEPVEAYIPHRRPGIYRWVMPSTLPVPAPSTL